MLLWWCEPLRHGGVILHVDLDASRHLSWDIHWMDAYRMKEDWTLFEAFIRGVEKILEGKD